MKVKLTNIGQLPAPFVKNTNTHESYSPFDRGENDPGMLLPGESIEADNICVEVKSAVTLKREQKAASRFFEKKEADATVTYKLTPSPSLKIEIV